MVWTAWIRSSFVVCLFFFFLFLFFSCLRVICKKINLPSPQQLTWITCYTENRMPYVYVCFYFHIWVVKIKRERQGTPSQLSGGNWFFLSYKFLHRNGGGLGAMREWVAYQQTWLHSFSQPTPFLRIQENLSGTWACRWCSTERAAFSSSCKKWC